MVFRYEGAYRDGSARGLVHSVAVTPANAHDATLMDECLHGQEKVIYGDKAYVSEGRKAQAEAQGVEWHVLRKATRRLLIRPSLRKFAIFQSFWLIFGVISRFLFSNPLILQGFMILVLLEPPM